MTKNMYRTQSGQVLTRTHGAEAALGCFPAAGSAMRSKSRRTQKVYIQNGVQTDYAIHMSECRDKQHLVAVLRHGAPRNPEQAHAKDYVQDGRRVVCCLARDEVGQHVSQRS